MYLQRSTYFFCLLFFAILSYPLTAEVPTDMDSNRAVKTVSKSDSYIAKGVEPEMLHRIATMASGGFDSLPHCGAVVAVLAIAGLTHKEGYKDLGVVTVIIPVFATLITIAVYSI